MLKIFKHMVIILMLISLSFLTVGCNTMQGMGEDVEAAGEEVQEQAD